MLSPLDFNTANLASHSNNDPKRVLAFIEEHIERLNKVEPTLNSLEWSEKEDHGRAAKGQAGIL